MSVREYVQRLQETPGDDSAHLEMDRGKEIDYLAMAEGRLQRIMDSIPVRSGPTRLLDVGTTPFTLLIKETYPHYDVWTLDRTALLRDRCRLGGVELRACDLDNSLFPFDDGFFDVVVFTEVLEHVFAPPTGVLREVKRIMAPGGRLILGVPNIARLSKRLRLLFGASPLPPADHQMNKDWVHGHGHIHEYTRSEIVSLCRSIDLPATSVRMLSPNPWDVLRGRLKVSFKRFVYICLVRLFPQFRDHIHIECCK